MIHKLTTSFAAIVLMAAGAIAHADTAKINLPDGFTHDGSTVYSYENGQIASMTHTDSITGPGQYVRQATTTIAPSTTEGKVDVDHTSHYSSPVEGSNSHTGEMHSGTKYAELGDTTRYITYSGESTTQKGTHTSSVLITPKTENNPLSFIRTSTYTSTDGTVSHYSNGGMTFGDNPDIYRHNTTTTSKGTHTGMFQTWSDYEGGIAFADHKGSFASTDGTISHNGTAHKNNIDSADNYHEGTTTTNKGTHTGSLNVAKSTTGGKSAIDHDGDFRAKDGSVSHDGYTVTDGNGKMTHQAETTDAKGTHRGSLKITASTTGGKSAVDHEGSFASRDGLISHYGYTVTDGNGSLSHEGTTTTAKGTHSGSLLITESTTGGKSAVDHDGDFRAKDGSVSHDGYTVTDGNGKMTHQAETTDAKGTHRGSLKITASTTGGKSAVDHEGSFASRDGLVSHYGYTVTDGNGSLSHEGTTIDLIGKHKSSLNITASTTGGNSAIEHEGSFALNKNHVFESVTHQGYAITDGNGTMSHWGFISGDKGIHNGTTEINKTTSNIDHEGAFTTNNGVIHNGETFVKKDAGTVNHSGSISGADGVAHEGSTVTDGNGGITHTASITGAGGATHEGTTTIVPSTTGGKPTINHTGSFTPFAIR